MVQSLFHRKLISFVFGKYERTMLEKLEKSDETNDTSWRWGLGIEHEVAMIHDKEDLYINAADLADHYKNEINLDYNEENDKYLQNLEPDLKDQYPVFIMFNPSTALKELSTDTDLLKLKSDGSVTMDYNEFSVDCRAWSDDPDMTGTMCMLEFVTQKYKNVTIEDAVTELQTIEEKVLKLVRSTEYAREAEKVIGEIEYPSQSMSRFVAYEQNGNLNFVSKNYFGSYHINLTLPYKSSVSEKPFKNEHLQVARMLQWLTPVIISLYGGGDSASFMDDGLYAEGSYRAATNPHSRPGGSDLKTDIPSERHLDKRPDWIVNLDAKGYVEIPKTCGEPTRTGDLTRCGTDFRRDPEKHTPPDKRFGFEFRIFDNIPNDYLPDLLLAILYIADHTYKYFIKEDKPVPLATENHAWINAMKHAVLYGWNGKIQKEYDHIIKNVLQFNTGTEYQSKMYWVSILKWLDKKYYEGGYYTDIIYRERVKPRFDLTTQSKPDLPNMWTQRKHIKHYFMNPEKAEKLIKLLKKAKDKTMTVEKFEKIAIEIFGQRIKSDITDLLDFLEYRKYIELKYETANMNYINESTPLKVLKVPHRHNLYPEDREFIPIKYPAIRDTPDPFFARMGKANSPVRKIGSYIDNIINLEFDRLF